jgi:hypothetical protein
VFVQSPQDIIFADCALYYRSLNVQAEIFVDCLMLPVCFQAVDSTCLPG